MVVDLFKLKGKVALVTGGSKGLGKAMARGLAEAGADIVISSRHENELRSALDEILQGTAQQGRLIVADMSRREEAKRLARCALEQMGRIDILINNAGTNLPEPIDEITDAAWDQVMEINLNSVMALTRALVPQMKSRRWGRIIHISSIMGFVSKQGRNAYSATKSALLGLARAGALELGPFNITVNCLAPGPRRTRGSGVAPCQRRRQLHYRPDLGSGWRLAGHVASRIDIRFVVSHANAWARLFTQTF